MINYHEYTFNDKNRISGSFRDPSGYVFCNHDGEIYRTINESYVSQWEHNVACGFNKEAIRKHLLLSYEEASKLSSSLVIHPVKVPFVTYPYEWSFEQLKQAALLTLDLQLLALDHGLILKDSSAFNIQYIGSKPYFIDHLSFECYIEGQPWAGYQQFCKHFLAPLLLARYKGYFSLKLLSQWIDGIPLDVASDLLPFRTKINPSILIHIHAHAFAQYKYSDARISTNKIKSLSIPKKNIVNITKSLFNMIKNLSMKNCKTEWGDYYEDTNYSSKGMQQKQDYVREFSKKGRNGGFAIDVGANTGLFSDILAEHYAYVVSSDVDPLAIDRNFQRLSGSQATRILPMVLDLSNPSPGLGWAGSERFSFQHRAKADCVAALALIHHLVITLNIPLRLIAEYFASLLVEDGILIIEFVPKQDSQVLRLLAARKDIYPSYTKENFVFEFSDFFDLCDEKDLLDSKRTVFLFKKK